MTPELRDSAPFGAVFSDHMLVADYANGKWGDPKIIPYGVQLLAAAPAVAHYGQGIFEGFKAFPRPNGGAVVFRPQANHARMARTCQRMAMPEVPASIFIDGTLALVALDRNWIPEKDGSALYISTTRYGSSDGNIVSVTGTTVVQDVITDIFDVKRRFIEFQNTESQPFWDMTDVDKGLTDRKSTPLNSSH